MHLETRFYSAGIPLDATVFVPELGNEHIRVRDLERLPPESAVLTTKYPAVLLIHGSYRDRNDGLNRYAEVLGEAGIVSLRFDLRGHGANAAHKYRLLCGSEMPYDLYSAINFMESLPFIDRGRIGVSGVSLGGALAIRLASEDARVRACAPMASPAWSRHDNPRRWGDRSDGILEMLANDARITAATGISRAINREALRADPEAAMAIGVIDELIWPGNAAYATLESVRDMMTNLNPLDFCGTIRCPILIMHGECDAAIPSASAQRLADAIPCAAHKEIRIYAGVQHNMPRDAQRERIFRDVADWFGATL